MSTVKIFEAQVLHLEGFRIRIRHGRDNRDVRSDHRLPATYRYQRRARSEWTVTEYIKKRLSPTLPGYQVEVVTPNGRRVNGKTHLSRVRQQFL
jgi:hypothetical protein